jgi:hypothetical protein
MRLRIFAWLALAAACFAAGETGFPRILIHNFNVRPPMSAEQIQALARRDLIVLAPIFRKDYQDIAAIRKLNPKIVILQYALTYQVAYDDRGQLSNDEEVNLFRDHPESWLVSGTLATIAKPVDPAARHVVLSKPIPPSFAKRFLPLLLCQAELMRVERIEGKEIEVLRGVLGTSMQPHPAGAPVVVVNQPTSWTTYYRKLTPHSEVVDINISDHAPKINGKQPWEIKAEFLARYWRDSSWRQAFNGFFLDEGQMAPARLDLNRDSLAEDPDDVYASMDRGERLMAARLRERCGDDLVLVFNNQDNIIPDASGRHREQFVDMRPGEEVTDWPSHFLNWAYSMEPFHAWTELGHQPAFPLNTSQPGTWNDFQQVRFGLASALLYGGYYQYRSYSGDTGNWRHWFDEYSVDANGKATNGDTGRNWLGKPLGNARQITVPLAGADRMHAASWDVYVSNPANASAELDQQGGALRVTIKDLKVARQETVVLSAPGTGTLLAGTEYTLTLHASASTARLIDVDLREPRGPSRAFASVYIKPQFEKHVLTFFVPPGKPLTAFRVAFGLGRDEGEIELNDVTLQDGVAESGWIREFENGLAVVNPTRRPQTLDILAGFRKILGTQDPRHNDGRAAGTRLEVAPLDAYILWRAR